MWYLYLDESGDLGFDFVNKKPSKFFTVTILAISSRDANVKIIKAAKKTLDRKLNPRGKRKRMVQELKGTGTTIEVKKYFFEQIKNVKFGVYSMTLNKKRLFEKLTREKERVYNWVAKQVIDKIPFEKADGIRVELILDKCKGKPEIEEFNSYIRSQLQARLNPNTPLDIFHWKSNENFGLQACDLFCWGIFQKHERKNLEWHDVYEKKILLDDVYLP